MGNCTTHAMQRRQFGSNIESSSSYNNDSHTHQRNLSPTNFNRIHTIHSYNANSRFCRLHQSSQLNQLIDETLTVLRMIPDTDQEPPQSMLLLGRIANQEGRWLDVMMALIDRVPIDNSLGATVMSLLVDECCLPSKESLCELIKYTCSDNRFRIKRLHMIIDEYITINSKHVHDSVIDTVNHDNQIVQGKENRSEYEKVKKTLSCSSKYLNLRVKSTDTSFSSDKQSTNYNLHHERNTLVLLSSLADKLVGPMSTSMLSTIALEFIIDRVYLGIYSYDQLLSLNIDNENVESNYSSILKIILFSLITIDKFSQTFEVKHILFQSLMIKDEQMKKNILEYYESWAASNNCIKRQIGFCAQYLLDNVFILDYRRPTYETIDHKYINIILNDKDVSEYLKIGPDGLEARSDSVSFESVRSTYSVNSDVWYYEVQIITDGVMQIGWATKQSKFLNQEGYGIGDDRYSVSYDGCRNLIWFDAKSMPHSNPTWKCGDIVGCLIDFDKREIIFSLNGRELEPFRKIFPATSNPIDDSYYAAASFMSYQHCRFNFGTMPYRYPPRRVQSFKSFNDHAHLEDDDKIILPKYKKLQLLRSIKINEQDCMLCVDDQANTLLEPCQHTGFCEKCALKLEVCPVCRSMITTRSIIKD